MSVITEYGHLLIILTCIFGFIMAWGVGANDVANAMGTSVAPKPSPLNKQFLLR